MRPSVLPLKSNAQALVRFAPLALPGAAVLGLVVVLAESHGGFASSVWYPAGLTVLAVLAVLALLAAPGPEERSRRTAVVLGIYGLFCAFSYLSILWADVPGQAWDAANRDLLYGLVLAIVTLRPWPRPATRLALVAIVTAVSGVAIATLIESTGGNPARLFLDGRLALPFGYANATADFWLVALWPALWLACAPDCPRVLRGLALSAAGLLMEISVLSQSRGAVLAFGLTAVLFIAFIPRRWPALVMLGACGIATALSWSALTSVRNARVVGAIGPAMTDARRAIVISVVVLGVVGAAFAWCDRRLIAPAVENGPSILRRGNALMGGLAGVIVIVVLAIIGNPASWAKARYHDFKTSGYSQVSSGGTRFTGSLGSNRYDFYRVSVDEFVKHPVGGLGAENFAVQYLQYRRSDETPTYPHSFAFGTLAGIGTVGSLLFLAFLVLAVRTVIASTRRAGVATTGLVVAAAAGFGMFFIHGLADWLWQFPALGSLAFALLGLAMRTCSHPPGPSPSPTPEMERELAMPPRPSPRRRTVLWRGALAALALLVAVSFALPGIAARLTESAYRVSATDPTLAIHRLSRAEDLNFLRADAPVAEGYIAQAIGQDASARTDFLRALSREPHNWTTYLLLGMLDANDGLRTTALRDLAAAHSLNPRQSVIGDVQGQVRAGRPVDVGAVVAQLASQLSVRLKPTG